MRIYGTVDTGEVCNLLGLGQGCCGVKTELGSIFKKMGRRQGLRQETDQSPEVREEEAPMQDYVVGFRVCVCFKDKMI